MRGTLNFSCLNYIPYTKFFPFHSGFPFEIDSISLRVMPSLVTAQSLPILLASTPLSPHDIVHNDLSPYGFSEFERMMTCWLTTAYNAQTRCPPRRFSNLQAGEDLHMPPSPQRYSIKILYLLFQRIDHGRFDLSFKLQAFSLQLNCFYVPAYHRSLFRGSLNQIVSNACTDWSSGTLFCFQPVFQQVLNLRWS